MFSFLAEAKEKDDGEHEDGVDTLLEALNLAGKKKIEDDGGRVITGLLASEPRARNI